MSAFESRENPARGLVSWALSCTIDRQWLEDVHLAGLEAPAFGYAVLFGSEDCPVRVELFASFDPLVTDAPIAVFELYADGDRLESIRIEGGAR